MLDGTNVCDRCGDEYDTYCVLIRDEIDEIMSYSECEYDNLCKPCRMYVTDYGAYLTKSEREELEPKKFVFEGENIRVSI